MQYPAQIGIYKVKTKGRSNWQNHNTACLDISIGQQYHEKDKLFATISWVSHRFEYVTIAVNDTLQRFTLMFEHGYDEQTAFKEAIKDGDRWLQRNQETIKMLPSYSIIRWENWRRDDNFERKLQEARDFYDQNDGFKLAIEQLIMGIWNRRYANAPQYHARKQDFIHLSREYLLEEAAVLDIMAKTRNDLHIYPGTFMRLWCDFQDAPNAPDLIDVESLRIDFSKNPNSVIYYTKKLQTA